MTHHKWSGPAAEDLTNDAMEGILSPQPSPENLRQQLEDSPSLTLTLSHNEDIARENNTGPPFSFENITISEEETASEETESPGLDLWSINLPQGPPVQSALWVRRTTVTIPSPTQEVEEITLDMPVTELLRRLQADLQQTRNTVRLTQAEIRSFPFS